MDKKKVVFVEPTGAHSNVFAKYMTIPMSGPVILATIARDAGYDSSVLNENILRRQVSDEEFAEADILGLSCMTTTISRGKDIARRYREVRKARGLESKAIIGGIHASMMPDDVAKEGYFDQVVVGEGEEVILDVLSGDNLDSIVLGKRVKDLDSLPIPDLSLVKGGERIRNFPIVTSRGCPYDCNFCSVTEMFGRGYRSRSPENVMEELRRYRGKTVFFVDDHFVIKKARTERLLEMMLGEGLGIDWSAQVRTEVTKDPAFVAQMRRAGGEVVYIGFESINPSSLKELNKRQSVEDIERSIDVLHRYGISVHGMFMFGSDHDTKDVFRTTDCFSRKKGIDFVQYMILTPLPGTGTYRQLEAEGRLLHRNWDFYDAMHVVFRPANMTPAELQQGMVSCYRSFYSYANGVKESIRDAVQAAVTSIRKTYTEAHFRSASPTLMKFAGKRILKSWLRHNRPYLDYLRDPFNSEPLPEKA